MATLNTRLSQSHIGMPPPFEGGRGDEPNPFHRRWHDGSSGGMRREAAPVLGSAVQGVRDPLSIGGSRQFVGSSMRRCRRLPTSYLCRHVGRMCIVDVHRFSASTGKWSFSIGKPKNSNNDLKTKNSNNETNEVRHGHKHIRTYEVLKLSTCCINSIRVECFKPLDLVKCF